MDSLSFAFHELDAAVLTLVLELGQLIEPGSLAGMASSLVPDIIRRIEGNKRHLVPNPSNASDGMELLPWTGSILWESEFSETAFEIGVSLTVGEVKELVYDDEFLMERLNLLKSLPLQFDVVATAFLKSLADAISLSPNNPHALDEVTVFLIFAQGLVGERKLPRMVHFLFSVF
jgi:hypothetical protein